MKTLIAKIIRKGKTHKEQGSNKAYQAISSGERKEEMVGLKKPNKEKKIQNITNLRDENPEISQLIPIWA